MLNPSCGGQLRELGVKVCVMPGGDTQLYAAFTECRDHIDRFMQSGGLYVGSCGGFGYLTSDSYNMQDSSSTKFVFVARMLNVIEAERGPVFGVGNMTPRANQTPAQVMKLPNGGPYSGNGAAVLVSLSDGGVGGYAGGFPATKLPPGADAIQHFAEVDGQPVAGVHIHAAGRNVLGFVYHPEFELGLPGLGKTDKMVWLANSRRRVYLVSKVQKRGTGCKHPDGAARSAAPRGRCSR
eukprot:TRINITY_DN28865_c0_g1_i3.p1 TRINITY_DN28865_c0_g1~~TRINITY_DN28865_c0_g1_i3.p1  ORF type:complete len:238 (+),score=0.88 TRINITY_DN28865_c0_g1_i3:426-1139(+)